MKYFVLAACLAFASTSFAWDNPDIEKKYESESGYKSRFGNEYQYDLSKPQDRIRYGTDYDAQRRDSLSVDPRRGIERGLGEYGGGVKSKR
jgi:hypothetical protein